MNTNDDVIVTLQQQVAALTERVEKLEDDVDTLQSEARGVVGR